MNETLKRILKLMQDNGISAHKLEVESAIAISSIQAWKSGKARPSLDAVTKIAEYFNVSVDYLVGKTDNPTPLTSEEGTIAVPNKYGDVLVALNEGDKDLTQDDIDQIVRFIKFTREQKKN